MPPREVSESSQEELRVRSLLQDAATQEAMPKRDLVRGAVRRLAFRRTSIANVNEFFGALRAIARGFATLLSVEEPSPREPRTKRTGDGTSHG